MQASQPYSINQPYTFEPEADSEIPASLNHQQNYEEDQQQISPLKNNNNQQMENNIKNGSAISGLNLCHGIFSESEPTSAAIIMNDQDLQKLKMFSPVLQTISDQEQDPAKKALDNELIDQIYEIRNQNRQSIIKLQPHQVQKNENIDQQQAERIQKNMILLNQISSSQDKMHILKQYNPKQYEINTIKEEKELSSKFQTREVDPILNSTPSLIKIDSQISNGNFDIKKNQFKIEIKNTDIQSPTQIQYPLSADIIKSMQFNKEIPQNQEFLVSKEIIDKNLNNNSSYQKEDEDFQEIINQKIQKINNIFNIGKMDDLKKEQQLNNQQDRQTCTPEKQVDKEIEIEKCTSPRLIKNNILEVKNQELEDLARLIQQATGSVNNIVENSQQLMQSRQYERIAAAKLRAKQKANQSSVNTTLQSQRINYQKQENINNIRHLDNNEIGNQDKIEDSQNDIKILSNLDQLIQNLEKQQQENIKFQNKFSSSKAFIQQVDGNEQNIENKKEIYQNIRNYINKDQEEIDNIEVIEILNRNINLSQQKQNQNMDNKQRMQTAHNKYGNRDIIESECNTEIKEAIIVDEKYQLKLQKQYVRPISGKSALSTSTNRYATSCQTQHVNVNSNIKKKEKQVEYQEFNDDDDDLKNKYFNQ